MVDDLERLGFVTEDKAIRERRKRTRLGTGDHELLRSAQTGEGLISITSMEQFESLVKAAGERMNEFQKMCEAMTQEQAEFIRKLRVKEAYSWRAVAEECYDQSWSNFNLEDWTPPSNQIMGMALCEKASSFYGEDYMQPPWN